MCGYISRLSYAEDRAVGCVIVKDGNIVSFSYNGMPQGMPNATELDGKTKPEVVHAEAGAIAKMAAMGIPTKGATLYCTLSPCIQCAKLIVTSGISRVVYSENYKDQSGVWLMQHNMIAVNQSPNEFRNQLIDTNYLKENTCLLS